MIKVSDEHFRYLRLQKGSLYRFEQDRPRWEREYVASLERDFKSFERYLPPLCWGLLDIGSGLGGVDVLIARHYALTGRAPHTGRTPQVHLLDGLADPPVMKLHRETFNDMRVAKDFQVLNGLPPGNFHGHGPDNFVAHPYDIILSLGSWCFHYPPAVYLRQVLRCMHRDTIVIVDVRRGREDYAAQLAEAFEVIGTPIEQPKFTRTVFVRRRVL